MLVALTAAVTLVLVAAAGLAGWWFFIREPSPNNETRLGCRLLAEAGVTSSPDAARQMVGDALQHFYDSNIEDVRLAAGGVDAAMLIGDDASGRAAMRDLDQICREHYASGW